MHYCAFLCIFLTLALGENRVKRKHHNHKKFELKNNTQDSGYGSEEQPGVSCQDIWIKNPESENGQYWISQSGNTYPVYCQFYPKDIQADSVARQEYPYPEEVNIALPVDEGDPEGAMAMQYTPEDLPPNILPHFTQDIIDDMEKMYWNKTKTISDLIDFKNELERNKTKEDDQKQHQFSFLSPFSLFSARDIIKKRQHFRKKGRKKSSRKKSILSKK